MSHRLFAIVSSILAVGAIGAGVSIADDPGGGYGGQSIEPVSPSQHSHNPSQQSGAGGPSEDMKASKLAWSAYLTGKAEVNASDQHIGAPGAKGTAMFFQADDRTLCYGFAMRGADEPTIVHIHKGAAGKAGPPVITFNNVPKNAAGQPSGNPGASSGCKTLEEPSELAALQRINANPANYYVNFHTKQFGEGALRGQLSQLLYDNKP